jgi:hypothetical protein
VLAFTRKHLTNELRRAYLFCLITSDLLSWIFEISNLMLSDWISFLAYPNLFGIKGFVVVVVPLICH